MAVINRNTGQKITFYPWVDGHTTFSEIPDEERWIEHHLNEDDTDAKWEAALTAFFRKHSIIVRDVGIYQCIAHQDDAGLKHLYLIDIEGWSRLR